MKQYPHLYIDGQWVDPVDPREVELIDPTREEAFARVTLGSAADADRAVVAARRAFESFSTTSVDERIALIDRIVEVYESHIDEFSELIAREVGIPVSNRAQVTGPADHMRVAREILREYPFESRHRQRHRPSRADRRLRADLAVELADPDRRHQDHLRVWPPVARSSPSPVSTPPRAAPSWPRCCTRPTCRRACSTW